MRKDNRRHIVDIRKDYFFRITCRSGEKIINQLLGKKEAVSNILGTLKNKGFSNQ